MAPMYMGGSYISRSEDAMEYVSEATPFVSSEAGGNYDVRGDLDNITQADESVLDRADTSAESVDLTQIVRVDGPGTKYAAKAKKARITQQTDDRMWTLKREGYSDKDICKIIGDELDIVYQPKSIGSRLKAIGKKKNEEEDQRLDEELSDWHVGDDEKLYIAYGEVEKKIDSEIQKLQAKKWNEVSKHLANKMLEKKYTANACKERLDGLLDGSALLPIELDPDQEGRAILRETRIAEAKRRREEAAEAKIRAHEAGRQATAQERLKKLQSKQDKKDQEAANQAKKEAEKRLRQQRAEGKKQEMLVRQFAKQQIQQKRQEKMRLQELENLVYSYYTGTYLQRRHHDMVKKGDQEDYLSSDSEEDEPAYLLEGEEDDASAAVDNSFTAGRKTESNAAGPSTKPKISKQTLLNPRSIMTDYELERLLATRGLPRRAAGETHPQLVARLAAADKALSMPDIDNLLQANFLSRKNSHKVKELRLQNYDAKHSEAGQRGVESTDLEFKKSYKGYGGKGARFIDED